MNLARLISGTAAKNPDKAAVIFEGTPWSYRAFDREVERYAAALHAAKQTQAAADILRVAGAVYPEFGNAELRAKLIEAQEQYSRGAPATQTAG